MIIYKGKYPKHIHSVFSLTSGGMGAVLNDGTLIQLDARGLGHWPPRPGTEINPSTYMVIGQSTKRRAK